MPAKGPGFGGSGRVGGGSRSAPAMRGSATRKPPKSTPTTYHGTSWKYKPGDVTKSTSATTSYSTAKRYSTSGRAGRGPWLPGTGPSAKASGKPTVYRVTPNGKTTTSTRKYRTTKSEVNSSGGWKIQGKAKASKVAMKAAPKPSTKKKTTRPNRKATEY